MRFLVLSLGKPPRPEDILAEGEEDLKKIVEQEDNKCHLQPPSPIAAIGAVGCHIHLSSKFPLRKKDPLAP